MSFANAFRRTTSPANSATSLPLNQPLSLSISCRTTSFIGQAIQATVAKLQQQSSNSSPSPSNSQQQIPQRRTDEPIKFRSYLDIREEIIDSKGNSSFTSVPR